jgi:hypothetical protein
MTQHIESDGDDKIDGLVLVYMTGARLDRSEDRDDTGYPYRLEVNLSPPQLMEVAFIMLHGGSEEIVVRAKTRAAIDTFIAKNDFSKHPRFRWMTITGPDGLKEEIAR